MARQISRENATHYLWGGASGRDCDAWHLVQTDAMAVIEERMPGGATERKHRHERARQFFYVLAGELRMEVEGAMHTVGAGQGLEIEPGEEHRAFNSGEPEVRFLVTSVPPAQGDRVEC